MTTNKGGEILEQIEKAGRKVLPMHEFLADADPDALDAYNRFLTATIYDNQALEDRYKEMVLACICVAVGSTQPVISNHCRRAMEAGLSREAMLQALEMTAAVMATRTMATGVTSLMEADTR